MTSIPELKALLANAASGTINAQQLARLIQISRSIAEAYLNHHRASVMHVCSFHGMTVSDLAMDCVAELFETDPRGRFTQLQNLQASLTVPWESIEDFDLFLCYKAFVIKVANARLAREYAQIDPAGARIHRNIKDALKESKLLVLREDSRGYVLYPATVDSHDHLEHFPLDLLERELSGYASVSLEIPDLLKSLHTILVRQEQYRRSVPLIDLVQVMKNIFRRFSPIDEDKEVEINLDDLHNRDLLPLKRQVLYAVNEKIVSTYLLKRKINREEAQMLSRVMQSIIADWFEQGPSQNSYYAHTRRIRPMAEEEYNTFWRKRVEYLARVAREVIKNYLEQNL